MNKTIRFLFIAAIFFTSCTNRKTVNRIQSRAEKPNIIVILSVGMGYSDLGCYGGEVETPKLDGLAANGLRFKQFSYSTESAGPWENPMGEKIGRRHDPSLFKDDDGSWWLIWGVTQSAKLKSDFTGFEGEPIKIGPSGDTKHMGHEGCLIMKIEGKYVLFGTGWSTGIMRSGTYNLYYAIADKITGPDEAQKFEF